MTVTLTIIYTKQTTPTAIPVYKQTLGELQTVGLKSVYVLDPVYYYETFDIL